jgi:hypothetical protein
MRKLKFAFLLSSLAASATLFAQNTTPVQSQSPAAKAPAQRPAQVAQTPAAGARATGAAAGQTGAEPAGLAGMGMPGAIAAGLTAIGAAAQNNEGNGATTHH